MRLYKPSSRVYVYVTIDHADTSQIVRWRVGRDGRVYVGAYDKIRAAYPGVRVSFGAPFFVND